MWCGYTDLNILYHHSKLSISICCKFIQQESIPVGCVPLAFVVGYGWGWVRPWRGYGPGSYGLLAEGTTPLPHGQNDTRMWKHYLSAISLAGGKYKEKYEIGFCSTNISIIWLKDTSYLLQKNSIIMIPFTVKGAKKKVAGNWNNQKNIEIRISFRGGKKAR